MTPENSTPDLVEQVADVNRQTLGYSRKRFIGTWALVGLIGIFTALALWLGLDNAHKRNAATMELASSGADTADHANSKSNDIYLFLRGQRGLPGVPGADGKDGSPGQPGSNAALLPPGPAGPQGQQGDSGSQGPQGAQGVQGVQGSPGGQGGVGPAGTAGAQGAEGPQGQQGDQGDAGAQGERGEKGDPGPQGAQGPPGPTGAQGPPGQDATGGVATTTVSEQSVVNPGNSKNVTVVCPQGAVVLGGGYSLDPQSTQLEVEVSRPTGEGWTVSASEEGFPASQEWSVTAYAVCADSTPPTPR